ncbi:MAG: biotin--[acetyl-CoA-carboxylase] ligase [Armatimonadota bacterium]
MKQRIHRFPILASTNSLALEWIRAGTVGAGDVLVTAEQTAGRGRPGRTWHSPRGALLCTLVLPFYPERAGWTALAAGVAAAQAARDLGATAGVKWPNDVVVERRKLAGILVETPGPALTAVGIGMNVSNPVPLDLPGGREAVALAEFAPDATPEQALEALLARIDEAWALLAAPDLKPLRTAWAGLDTTSGRRVRRLTAGPADPDEEGVALGVADDGALQIRLDSGRLLAAHAGEIELI